MKLLFKFRIALLSFAISGVLLLIFGIALFAFIFSSGIGRMDQELRSLAEAPLRGSHPEDYWKNFGNSVSFIYADRQEHIAVNIHNRQGQELFSSEHFPKELTTFLPPVLEAPQPAGSASAFIDRLDRNKDNKVDRNEFDGPPLRFDVHDVDRDGYIDAEEAQGLPGRPPGASPHPQLRAPPSSQNRPMGPAPQIESRKLTVHIGEKDWRLAIFSTRSTTVLLAMDMDAFNAEIHQFQTAFMIAVPTALILLGAAGWFLAGRAMKPIAAIAETAESITAKDLDKRIPKVGNDIELERLVDVANNMLERLERSYHQAVRFSADAAHELQTPLTILQGELDNAIQSSENGSTEQQRYSMLLEETRNLKAVVQKLLLLAHADEGHLNLNRQPTNLSELVENAAEDIEFMAPKLKIKTHIEKGVTIPADPALLNQVIRNMTSNAAKYSPANGHATFTVEKDTREVRFILTNTAPPIPDEDQSLLFDRFHQVEKSRTTAGSGLGLSLAREIARAHGGNLVLNPYTDGMVSFTLNLPLKV